MAHGTTSQNFWKEYCLPGKYTNHIILLRNGLQNCKLWTAKLKKSPKNSGNSREHKYFWLNLLRIQIKMPTADL